MDRLELIRCMIIDKAMWRFNLISSFGSTIMFCIIGTMCYYNGETEALMWAVIGAIFMGATALISHRVFVKCKNILDEYMEEDQWN